ncbi:hypothetical protein BV898_17942 [Hypsibius exemplaris]|uniref:Uncharacterized protein n=1 Tax=Hypsibius exemplaris TaxID=2072580 RepID=A0A9X6NN40_HYPEX|nr:hypothetical protein BV898_17942 [Hypsibius exemplaris]
MEFIELGNLGYLCTTQRRLRWKLKMSMGRVKRNIMIALQNGMAVLHSCSRSRDIKRRIFSSPRKTTPPRLLTWLARLRGKDGQLVEIQVGAT